MEKNNIIQFLIIGLLKIYRRFLSPWFGRQCRYTPSCSLYMMKAVKTHGAGKGTYLGVKRVLKCNPLCQGGHDPVPTKTSFFS